MNRFEPRNWFQIIQSLWRKIFICLLLISSNCCNRLKKCKLKAAAQGLQVSSRTKITLLRIPHHQNEASILLFPWLKASHSVTHEYKMAVEKTEGKRPPGRSGGKWMWWRKLDSASWLSPSEDGLRDTERTFVLRHEGI